MRRERTLRYRISLKRKHIRRFRNQRMTILKIMLRGNGA
jgi:hypothetical protein